MFSNKALHEPQSTKKELAMLSLSFEILVQNTEQKSNFLVNGYFDRSRTCS